MTNTDMVDFGGVMILHYQSQSRNSRSMFEMGIYICLTFFRLHAASKMRMLTSTLRFSLKLTQRETSAFETNRQSALAESTQIL